MDEQKTLIGRASVYNKTYYYNNEFAALPTEVLNEIQKICTYYAEKLHCVFALKFRENGDVYFECVPEEFDQNFDEIGAKLDLDKLARTREKLFIALKTWYQIKDQLPSANESGEGTEGEPC